MGVNVIVFVPSFEEGGAERAMVKIANGLYRRGWWVEFVVIKNIGRLKQILEPGIGVVSLDWPLDPYLKGGAFVPLVRHVGRRSCAVWITALHSCNLLTTLGKRVTGRPEKIIITVHTSFRQQCTMTRSRFRAWMRAGMQVGMKKCYPAASLVVAASDGIRRELVDWLRIEDWKISKVEDPVIDDEFWRRSGERVEHPWFMNKTVPVIVAVGRLGKEKNYPCLLRALGIVRRQIEARLIILGEGSERENLEKVIDEEGLTDAVNLPGFIENPYPYMREADVFVLCSIREGLPTVLVEALACRAHVVATDCQHGPTEILEGGRWGKLVPVGNSERLASAIFEVLRNRDVKEGAWSGAEMYSTDSVVRKYEQLIERVMGDNYVDRLGQPH